MAGELISREALDRIIQRAAELQTGERDIGDGLTEEELLATQARATRTKTRRRVGQDECPEGSVRSEAP